MQRREAGVTANVEGDAGDQIDPDVASFVDTILAGSRDYADFAARPLTEQRAILERVRAPWRVGQRRGA